VLRCSVGPAGGGYRLAQHVDASPCFEGPDGAPTSRLNVWTDLVSEVKDGVAAVRLCSTVNMQQTMSALVYDSENRTISESFTAVLYTYTVRGWGKVMATAAAVQNTAAHPRRHSPRRKACLFELVRTPTSRGGLQCQRDSSVSRGRSHHPPRRQGFTFRRLGDEVP